jgi:gas vesicle protein
MRKGGEKVRAFWQGVLFGGLAGIIVGVMAAPRLQEEMKIPIIKKGGQISNLAQRALRGVQENVSEIWQRRMTRE